MDPIARLTTLLARAEADGGRVISIAAVRRALTAYIFQGMPFDTRLIAVDGVEVIGWDWCDAIDRAEYTNTAPIFRRRLEYAIDAWQFGSCHYLEDGWKR